VGLLGAVNYHPVAFAAPVDARVIEALLASLAQPADQLIGWREIDAGFLRKVGRFTFHQHIIHGWQTE